MHKLFQGLYQLQSRLPSVDQTEAQTSFKSERKLILNLQELEDSLFTTSKS